MLLSQQNHLTKPKTKHLKPQPHPLPQIQLQTTTTEHEMMITGVTLPIPPPVDERAPGSLVTTFAITSVAILTSLNNMRHCLQKLF